MPQAAILPQSPQPPTPADLNKASFHVFIELPLRHFPAQSGSLRLWEQGWGWAGERAKARSWGWAAATPSSTPPAAQPRGAGPGGSGEAMLLAPVCSSAKWGPHPCLPRTQAPAARICAAWGSGLQFRVGLSWPWCSSPTLPAPQKLLVSSPGAAPCSCTEHVEASFHVAAAPC